MMESRVYGDAIKSRLGIPTNPLIPTIQELIMLCREHKGTLVQKDGSFMLHYQGVCQIVGSSVNELEKLKGIFK